MQAGGQLGSSAVPAGPAAAAAGPAAATASRKVEAGAGDGGGDTGALKDTAF
jgi:hypothetical protein